MPRCIKCDKFLAPDLMVDVGEPGLDGTIPMRCIFCEQNLTEFGGNTKEEHIRDYDVFLKKLAKTKNVSDLVKEKPLII